MYLHHCYPTTGLLLFSMTAANLHQTKGIPAQKSAILTKTCLRNPLFGQNHDILVKCLWSWQTSTHFHMSFIVNAAWKPPTSRDDPIVVPSEGANCYHTIQHNAGRPWKHNKTPCYHATMGTNLAFVRQYASMTGTFFDPSMLYVCIYPWMMCSMFDCKLTTLGSLSAFSFVLTQNQSQTCKIFAGSPNIA